MEKLLKLLNEYEKIREKLKEDEEQRYKREKSIIGEGVWRCDTFEDGDNIMSDVAPSYIISKSYGFIGWLVETDKIDFNEVSKKELATGWNLENNILDEDNTKESWIKFWTENLLMLLAISDTPIDDLISYLK